MVISTLETAPAITPEGLGLWPPQLAAVQRMREYIHACQGRDVEQAALVHMPTGSGKTGVIAALARCTPEAGCVLILTPHADLRTQLFRDVRGAFFCKLHPPLPEEALPKQVVEIDAVEPFQAVQDFPNTVLIATIQMADAFNKRHPAEWETLLRKVSLVLVDEGHYEPAHSWSQTIRSFQVPRIIFTATPFRNDLKIFDIDPDHIFSYTFQQALQDNILREVEFVRREPAHHPIAFVDDLLAFYDEKFGGLAGEKPRVIVRCDDSGKISQIAGALQARGRDYIAIHETFSDRGEDPHRRRTVPNPRVEPATFWIHQYKLQEGIDDPRFQVLALFDPLLDGRGLVQQIGRIIRNPDRDPLAKGYVLDHSNGKHIDLWLGFLNYDRAITAYGPGAFNLATGAEWMAGLFESQQALTYLKNRFRTPLDFDKLVPREDLILPRMVNLRARGKGFHFPDFCELLEMAFREQDRIFHKYETPDGAVIYLYVRFDNSPLLRKMYFLEPQLGLTYLRQFRGMLAYYDSSGYLPVDFHEAHLGRAVGTKLLRKLISAEKTSRLTSVSLRNSNLETIAVRGRTISAADIQATVPAMDDHSQVCTSATGYSAEPEGRPRRYLGFQRGRVAESSRREPLDNYNYWLGQVVHTLREDRPVLPAFQRYAQLALPGPGHTPRHILLDLAEVENSFETAVTQEQKIPPGKPLEIMDASCEIAAGSFELKANKIPIQVSIRYDHDGGRYLLKSKELDEFYCRREGDPDKRGLIAYLNQEQAFRLIPDTDNLIYMFGEYYEPPFRVGRNRFRKDLFEVSQILEPVPLLEKIGEEKGLLEPVAPGAEQAEKRTFPPDGLRWSEDSLFGIIDRLGAPAGLKGKFFGQPDILVCDDMGTESADFILADTGNQRVRFIHAKASKARHPISASALQEVVGQATKNLNFLGMFNEAIPDNLDRWQTPWMDAKNKKKKLSTGRIRIGNLPADETWEQIHALLHHPLVDREVWLFLGRMLSKSKFEAELEQDTAGAEALQAAYLLFGAMTNIASVGAKLRVFCYP